MYKFFVINESVSKKLWFFFFIFYHKLPSIRNYYYFCFLCAGENKDTPRIVLKIFLWFHSQIKLGFTSQWYEHLKKDRE